MTTVLQQRTILRAGSYLYSLKPAPNPNPFDDRARRGQRILQQQGSAGCHTPPPYADNKRSGQAETQEEWLDPSRLKDDNVPKGFHLGAGPINGHKFGLNSASRSQQTTGRRRLPS